MGHGHAHAPATAAGGQRRRLAVVLVPHPRRPGRRGRRRRRVRLAGPARRRRAHGHRRGRHRARPRRRHPRPAARPRTAHLRLAAAGDPRRRRQRAAAARASPATCSSRRSAGSATRRRSASGLMLVVAAVGLVVNLVSLAVLHRGRTTSLNVRGAYLEVLADALGSVAVIVAALVIAATGWTPADIVASVVIGVPGRCPRAWHLLREALDVLLEAAPRGVDLDDVRVAHPRGRRRPRRPRPARLDDHLRAAGALGARRRHRRGARRRARRPGARRALRVPRRALRHGALHVPARGRRRTPATRRPSTTEKDPLPPTPRTLGAGPCSGADGWDSGAAGPARSEEASVEHGHHSGMWVPGEPPTWGRMFLPHLGPVVGPRRAQRRRRCWSTWPPWCGCAGRASRWPWWRTRRLDRRRRRRCSPSPAPGSTATAWCCSACTWPSTWCCR